MYSSILIQLLLALQKSVDRSVELLSALEEQKLHQEDVLKDLGASLLDEIASSSSRATGGHDVVHNNNLISGLESVLLESEDVLTVLLLVNSGVNLSGKLAGLAHRNEADIKGKRKHRTEKEASGVQTNNHSGLQGLNVSAKKLDELAEKLGLLENGHDVLEKNTLAREVLVLAEGGAELLNGFLLRHVDINGKTINPYQD